ncbi:ImmA/IrrE family metallo-endopeptidase [Rhodophyticola sp. CCM32]|uniref:ImmA/IrrE family metallo-endopeptidase n=1 Tax=Rhodophyticola sp. CCM32 TaxID=2916397 RepID=UPI00107F2A1A|nr:ImmA/IrrE family metallo-endopeptidase [Rhodophyticola sp. CCM32]QBY00281.1 ImmA/IrrE family metallo-endopeptidase [Rhodophyticola sp. CCM32]
MAQSREWTRLSGEHRALIEEFQANESVAVGALAQRLGLRIKVANLGPGNSGQISRNADGGYIIKVNRFEAKERQRFTIAHEIAHFLLHRDIIDASPEGIRDTVLYRSGAPENIEYQANRLAADILMPRGSVERRLGELGGRVSEGVIEVLAQDFKVSKGAMEIRLQNVAA